MTNIHDPWDNETINDKIINNEQVIRACPACSYVGNSLNDTNCYICRQKLTKQKFPQSNKINLKLAPNLEQKKKGAVKLHPPQNLKTAGHLTRKSFRQSNAKIYSWVRNCTDQLLTIWLSYPEKTKKFIILAVGVFLSTLIFSLALNSANLSQSKNEQAILAKEYGHSDMRSSIVEKSQALKARERVRGKKVISGSKRLEKPMLIFEYKRPENN